jgi:hypothetical protein
VSEIRFINLSSYTSSLFLSPIDPIWSIAMASIFIYWQTINWPVISTMCVMRQIQTVIFRYVNIHWQLLALRAVYRGKKLGVAVILLVEETGVLGENHRLVASHWQNLSHNLAYIAWAGFEPTTLGDRW